MNVQILDYSHKVIITYVGDINPIYEKISRDSSSISVPLLSSIDPYGITYFNYNQFESFIKNELLELRKTDHHADSGITEFLDFVGNMKQHQYLKIIGE